MKHPPAAKRRALAALAGFVFLAALLIPAEIRARRKWPARTGIVGSTPEFDYFHLQIHGDRVVQPRGTDGPAHRGTLPRPLQGQSPQRSGGSWQLGTDLV